MHHWLPDHHLGVAATLSHSDELIGLPRQDKITVRMPLNHTGGIADYASTFDQTPAGLRRLGETAYTPAG